MSDVSLELFSDPVRAWFESSFAAPTAAQTGAWGPIAVGRAHAALRSHRVPARRLAAFLWAIDALGRDPRPDPGVRVLYISPLRALAVDVDKNLRAPLRGIRMAAERLGQPFVEPLGRGPHR